MTEQERTNQAASPQAALPLPPAPDVQALQGAQEVWDLALALTQAQERLRQAQAEALGLRPPLFALLEATALAAPNGPTVSEAAARLGVRPQALSGPARELSQAGLLERAKDEQDSRARRLTLTPAGQQAWARAQALHQRLLREVLGQVPHASVAKLVLARLGEAARRALEPAD